MNLADVIILLIILASGLLALRRGFTREAFSLLTWVAAFVIARLFSPGLEVMLDELVDTPSARAAMAFGLLFAATLVVGALINHLLGELVRVTGLSNTDRMFGVAFGLLRGMLLVVVLVALARHPFGADPWWQESRLIPVFSAFEDWTVQVVTQLAEFVMSIGND